MSSRSLLKGINRNEESRAARRNNPKMPSRRKNLKIEVAESPATNKRWNAFNLHLLSRARVSLALVVAARKWALGTRVLAPVPEVEDLNQAVVELALDWASQESPGRRA